MLVVIAVLSSRILQLLWKRRTGCVCTAHLHHLHIYIVPWFCCFLRFTKSVYKEHSDSEMYHWPRSCKMILNLIKYQSFYTELFPDPDKLHTWAQYLLYAVFDCFGFIYLYKSELSSSAPLNPCCLIFLKYLSKAFHKVQSLHKHWKIISQQENTFHPPQHLCWQEEEERKKHSDSVTETSQGKRKLPWQSFRVTVNGLWTVKAKWYPRNMQGSQLAPGIPMRGIRNQRDKWGV